MNAMDALDGYLTVYAATQALASHGAVLGRVINGVTYYDEVYGGVDADETPEDTWARDLGQQLYVASCATKFAHGTAYVSTGASLAVEGGAPVDLHKDGVPLAAVLAAATPARYGDLKTQTTVTDASVRAAVELAASQFTFAWDAVNGGSDSGDDDDKHDALRFSDDDAITAVLRSRLVGVRCRAVPYKVNVYGAGGFFKPHVDTPTVDTQRMLGTLVVCLPSAFTGGALIVHAPTAGAAPCVFDWAPLSGDTTALQWAAFFGDCVHEVAPVTSGHRVTVTFVLLAAEAQVEDVVELQADEDDKSDGASSSSSSVAKPSPVPDAPPTTALPPLVTALVRTLAARPPQFATMGILLTQKYTLSALEAGACKGLDEQLASALRAAGMRFSLRAVAYAASYVRSFSGYDDGNYESNTVYAFDAHELKALRTATTRKRILSSIPFVRCASRRMGHGYCEGAWGVQLQHTFQAGAEYTGNEALPEEDEHVYFAGALVLEPPSAAASGGAAAASGAGGAAAASGAGGGAGVSSPVVKRVRRDE